MLVVDTEGNRLLKPESGRHRIHIAQTRNRLLADHRQATDRGGRAAVGTQVVGGERGVVRPAQWRRIIDRAELDLRGVLRRHHELRAKTVAQPEQVVVAPGHAKSQGLGIDRGIVVQIDDQCPGLAVFDQHIDIERTGIGTRAQQRRGGEQVHPVQAHQLGLESVEIRHRAFGHRRQLLAHPSRRGVLGVLDASAGDFGLDHFEANHAVLDLLLRNQHRDAEIAAVAIGGLERLAGILHIGERTLFAHESIDRVFDACRAQYRVAFNEEFEHIKFGCRRSVFGASRLRRGSGLLRHRSRHANDRCQRKQGEGGDASACNQARVVRLRSHCVVAPVTND